MKALIVATNQTPDSLKQDVNSGCHQRVDYFELAERLDSEYLDYNAVTWARSLERVEEKVKIDFRLAGEVTRRARRARPDVVFSLSERVGLPLAMMLPKRTGHVVMMHHPMSSQKIKLMRASRLAGRWDHILTLSQAEADGLRDALGLDEHAVSPIYSPVDTDFYRPLDPDIPPEEQDHVLSLGLSHRDYPTLIRAMQRLPHIPCQIRANSYWVKGPAGYEQLAIPDNIALKSFVHPSKLREVYARARFIVVTIRDSTQWSAGCTSVLQSQSMGRAVIATDLPGLREYVSDGETGILVPPGNDEAMASAIEELWRNPERAAAMGKRGRERMVNGDFEFGRWLDKTTDVVESIAAGKAA